MFLPRTWLLPAVLKGAWLVLVSASTLAGESPRPKGKPSAKAIRFFETKVRPLLADHCYECHGPKKQNSGLRLDSLQGMMEGGESGPAIVAGEPKSSLLITAVSYDDPDLQMPPEKKLSDRQVADLIRWIEIGAPHPDADPQRRSGPTAKKDHRTIDIAAGRKFWAFQPPRDRPVPAVRDTAWPQSPLDHFILAKLEAHALKPAPPADKRTLLRRVTFDFVGLPPTPAENEAFLSDESPEAFAKVVDRLLASPHYGERWGRHWLDVARYADSNGLDENVAHGNAWRYRDYVVAAFNRDKPYDQFVMEQLAGDLLPTAGEAARIERLIATGFLSLGPKVLAEVDETKMEMDIVDEQVDTLGRAFLGLTLGCARCHDHKFDPLPTADYYSLAGIFKSTRTMEHFKKVARWYENSIATNAELADKAEHDRRVTEKQQALEAFIQQANDQAKKTAASRGNKSPKNLEALYPAKTKAGLKRLREELDQLKASAAEIPTAMGATEGAVADVKVHVRGSHLTLGESARRGFPQVLIRSTPSPIPDKQSGRLQLAQWLISGDHPLTARVMVNRLWRWHFGRGIVRTPDNFGNLGERPTNQPLLDWLAQRFVQSGWSVKAMHRLIVLSATYQMSSRHDAAAKVDPENRLHYRANIRRLEAEAIRDSLLAVSGSLDRHMGGSMLHVKNRGYFFDHTSKDTTSYARPRRSIYLPVVRNHLYDVFQLFDYSDASVLTGNRATSTVAPQALFMLNSDFMSCASELLAERLLRDEDDEAKRIEHLYRSALGRPPSQREAVRALTFLRSVEPMLKNERQAWQLLCQTVLASNEFVYVR